ncbi:MAG TPA: hypothetical protein VKX17_01575 [Planctomycetota bacterium]|nr:hypothetical protein [Planctomycetota bacterium]
MIQPNSHPRFAFARLLLPLLCLAAVCAVRAEDDSDKPEAKKLTRQVRPELLAPENAVLLLSTPDVKKARAAFEHTAFKSLLSEDEILTPINAAFGKLRETYVKGDGTRGEAELKRRNEEVDMLLKIMPMLESQVTLVVDADAAALNSLSSGKLPRFMLIASMPPGDAGSLRQQEMENAFDQYRGRLAIDAHYRDFDSDRGVYKIHGLENTDLGIYESWTFVENLFIYAQGKGLVEDAIERFSTKKGAGSMALNASYQSAYKQVGRDDKGEALVFVQFQPLELVSAADRSPWMKALAGAISLGAENARPLLALGMNVPDGNDAAIREKLFVRAAAKDIPKITDGCKGLSANFVANDELFYWASLGNLSDIFAASKESLGSFFGSAAAMESRLSGAIGAKDPADLKKKLDLFKGEFSLFLDYAPRNSKIATWGDILGNFQYVICMEIDKDNVNYERELKDLMTKLENGTGIQYLTTNTSGSIIRYQRGAAKGEDPSALKLGLRDNLGNTESKTTPFFAAWAKVDMDTEGSTGQRHFVLLTDDLPSLRKAMSQRSSPRTSLYEDQRFKTVMKSFREARSEITYFDLVKLSTIYNQLMPLMTKAELIDRESIDKYPSANALRPHLFALAAARSAASNGEGILTEYSSPTGNLSLAALIASVAWPAITTQRQRSISDDVDSKFKQIMLALQLYSADFDRYPPQLSDLLSSNSSGLNVSTGYIDMKRINLFESPFNRGALAAPQDVDNADLTNLVYVANHTLQDLGSEILMYEKQPTRLEKDIGTGNWKLVHHVLQVDGKIRGMTKAALERVLQNKFTSTKNLDNKGAGKAGTTPAANTPKPPPPPKKKN